MALQQIAYDVGTETTIDEAAALRDKINAVNAEEGTLGYVQCNICHNRGYIAKEKNGTVVMAECSCMAQRRSLRRIENSGLADAMQKCTFPNFETVKDWQAKAKARAISFTSEDTAKWFFVSGGIGSGKTHLCTAICGHLIGLGKEVRYFRWREDAPRLKALVNERDEYEREMNQYKTVPVLYIDDLFKGTITDADINLAFELVNARYIRRSAITVFSSELNIEKIIALDEAVGSRIYEKSKGYCMNLPNENWRLR